VVEKGEDALRALGFRQFRVRHHGEIVRIEIAREELERALDPAMAAKFTGDIQSAGLQFVTLDLEGFRSGSMNALLSAEIAPADGLSAACRWTLPEPSHSRAIHGDCIPRPAPRYEDKSSFNSRC